MDMFFAAVEMRDNPAYRNVPLAVGGRPDGRGIISTANYLARKFDVHSALASSIAIRRCPKLVIVPGRYDAYKEVSKEIMTILSEYSDKISLMGLDEAYIDVTDSLGFHGSATWCAMDMKRRIWEATGLTASAGVAPNMFLAKVASDWNKPNGIKVITPHEVKTFVADLPLKLIPGVGKKANQRLLEFGLKTCADIQKAGPLLLKDLFGSWGTHLYELSHGVDQREVGTRSPRKSLSTEQTYSQDIDEVKTMERSLEELCDDLLYRLERYRERQGERSLSTLQVKLKFQNFKRVTAERSYSEGELDYLWQNRCFNDSLKRDLKLLLAEAYQRESLPVRLIGVGVRFKENKKDRASVSGEEVQLDLFSYDPSFEMMIG